MREKPNRFYSKKQEKRGNNYLGLKNTANSGATTFDKGDGRDEWLLMEWKTLTKPQKSRKVEKEWFTKNKEEAFNTGKTWNAVGFDFGDGQDYVAVDLFTFRELYNAWKELNGIED